MAGLRHGAHKKLLCAGGRYNEACIASNLFRILRLSVSFFTRQYGQSGGSTLLLGGCILCNMAPSYRSLYNPQFFTSDGSPGCGLLLIIEQTSFL